jgi:hypothetical protein
MTLSPVFVLMVLLPPPKGEINDTII